jgi:hypothetical protein
MRITLFTVEEASRAIATLRPDIEKLRAQKREFDRLETRADVLAVATAGAAPDNPDSVELRGLADKRRRLGEAIARGIEQVTATGVLLKDLDRGLCDFYTLAGDRLVFLCWQPDETEVSHWHSLDGGFAGRRPLKNAELD